MVLKFFGKPAEWEVEYSKELASKLHGSFH
jgi:hypothetical protein